MNLKATKRRLSDSEFEQVQAVINSEGDDLDIQELEKRMNYLLDLSDMVSGEGDKAKYMVWAGNLEYRIAQKKSGRV